MKRLKIVVADDSPMIRDMLRHTLTQVEGLALVGEAGNGIEAIRLIRELNPDLVVLDISMPEMGGFEVVKEIRKHDRLTVIVMFTAAASPWLEEACLEVGANFFLSKCEIEELIEICRLELLFKAS